MEGTASEFENDLITELNKQLDEEGNLTPSKRVHVSKEYYNNIVIQDS